MAGAWRNITIVFCADKCLELRFAVWHDHQKYFLIFRTTSPYRNVWARLKSWRWGFTWALIVFLLLCFHTNNYNQHNWISPALELVQFLWLMVLNIPKFCHFPATRKQTNQKNIKYCTGTTNHEYLSLW